MDGWIDGWMRGWMTKDWLELGVLVLMRPLASCMTLDKPFNPSRPLFPHLYKGGAGGCLDCIRFS